MIEGKVVLQYILERLQQVFTKEQIIIATSNELSDDPIADFAVAQGVKTYRGSLNNVARRFYEAAEHNKFEFAVRINGDNLFIDTALLKEMVDRAVNKEYDFLSNVKGRTFPKGMSIEIVKVSHYFTLLESICARMDYSEHVTLYFYENESGGNYSFVFNDKHPEAAGVQLALDTKDDLNRSRKLINLFTRPHYMYNLAEILELLKTV